MHTAVQSAPTTCSSHYAFKGFGGISRRRKSHGLDKRCNIILFCKIFINDFFDKREVV